MKKLLFILLVAATMISCDKAIVLDLKQTQPRVVIEGLVTNHEGFQYVKLSRSTAFYATGNSPRVTDATVTITDSDGQVISYVHNPRNHADSAGYYLPAVPFVGVVGKSYHLTALIDGVSYEAEDPMQPITHIDSLTYKINDDEQEDPKDFNKFYELELYAKEPQQTTDFYLFKFYRNDSLTLYNDTDIYFADDETLGENIDGVTSPVYYAVGDRARVEMYSLSPRGFTFYDDLQKLLTSDGGMFNQPPANSRNNLNNGALGFFQVSAVDVSTIVIDP